MGLYDKAWEFIDAAKETTEYIELLEAKKDVEKNDDLRNQINSLFCELAEVNSTKNSQNIFEGDFQELCSEFENLRTNLKVERFFKASQEFNTMMSKVYTCIIGALQSSLCLNSDLSDK